MYRHWHCLYETTLHFKQAHNCLPGLFTSVCSTLLLLSLLVDPRTFHFGCSASRLISGCQVAGVPTSLLLCVLQLLLPLPLLPLPVSNIDMRLFCCCCCCCCCCHCCLFLSATSICACYPKLLVATQSTQQLWQSVMGLLRSMLPPSVAWMGGPSGPVQHSPDSQGDKSCYV